MGNLPKDWNRPDFAVPLKWGFTLYENFLITVDKSPDERCLIQTYIWIQNSLNISLGSENIEVGFGSFTYKASCGYL